MATNLDIDIAAVEELMRLGAYRSKREAVDAAVRQAIAWRRQATSLDYLGTVAFPGGPAASVIDPRG
jgi:Arc/MetJ family transcription regulator